MDQQLSMADQIEKYRQIRKKVRDSGIQSLTEEEYKIFRGFTRQEIVEKDK